MQLYITHTTLVIAVIPIEKEHMYLLITKSLMVFFYIKWEWNFTNLFDDLVSVIYLSTQHNNHCNSKSFLMASVCAFTNSRGEG